MASRLAEIPVTARAPTQCLCRGIFASGLYLGGKIEEGLLVWRPSLSSQDVAVELLRAENLLYASRDAADFARYGFFFQYAFVGRLHQLARESLQQIGQGLGVFRAESLEDVLFVGADRTFALSVHFVTANGLAGSFRGGLMICQGITS